MSKGKRKGRNINGLLLLDKSQGLTSNSALQKVKKLFNAAKAGHTGSLDPLATGLLVVCFGRATKISEFLLTADKHYQVSLQLGVSTNSGDADGDVIEKKDASQVTDYAIQKSIEALTGGIEQVPPMYSALKVQGVRLHKLARQGIEIERKARSITIYDFQLLERKDDLLHMQVHCSKGTYIRTLVEDLGKSLNCGAHVVKLRRIGLGPFEKPKMYSYSTLQEQLAVEEGYVHLDQLLLPTDCALQAMPAVHIEQKLMQYLYNGVPVKPAKSVAQDVVRIYDANKEFYGIGRVLEDGRIATKRLN